MTKKTSIFANGKIFNSSTINKEGQSFSSIIKNLHGKKIKLTKIAILPSRSVKQAEVSAGKRKLSGSKAHDK